MSAAKSYPLDLDTELQDAIERILAPGESLGAFIDTAVREALLRRQQNDEFVARGLAGLRDAQATGEYCSPDDVLRELDQVIAEAERLRQ